MTKIVDSVAIRQYRTTFICLACGKSITVDYDHWYPEQ